MSGCQDPIDRCAGKTVSPGDTLTCRMPGWADRGFDLHVPSRWDGVSSLPVVLALHGGGGNKRAAARVTCPDGREGHAGCLSAIARSEGFAVVLPDGTGARPARNVRTWNAGGGTGTWNCTSGGACKTGIDDVRYVRELLAELRRVLPVDGKRIYATGLSNGAAMAHRLACELPDEIAAIAAVGGTNQFAAAGGSCPSAVPVLQIHGTKDPCWTYTQSSDACILEGNGVKVGVEPSMEFWRTVNGCNATRVETPLPDASKDDTSSVRVTWGACTVATELIRIEGGGHTWPNGHQYFDSNQIGRVPRDFGSDVLVEFFRAHPKP